MLLIRGKDYGQIAAFGLIIYGTTHTLILDMLCILSLFSKISVSLSFSPTVSLCGSVPFFNLPWQGEPGDVLSVDVPGTPGAPGDFGQPGPRVRHLLY